MPYSAPLMDEHAPIAHWIVCICGFRQDRSGPTGMEQIWLALRSAYEDRDCRVALHNWNDPWSDVAAQILRLGPTDRSRLEVSIVAYSWGMGHGALTLCRELGRLGVRVRLLVSIDGVYHSWRALWRALWSPLFGRPCLVVPDNVGRVHYFRQEVDFPRGHAVVAEDDEATQLWSRGVLPLGHCRIDESPSIRNETLKLCRPSATPSGGAV